MKINIQNLAYELDAKNQQVFLQSLRPKCPACGKFGQFLGTFCNDCYADKSQGYKTFETLKRGYR